MLPMVNKQFVLCHVIMREFRLRRVFIVRTIAISSVIYIISMSDLIYKIVHRMYYISRIRHEYSTERHNSGPRYVIMFCNTTNRCNYCLPWMVIRVTMITIQHLVRIVMAHLHAWIHTSTRCSSRLHDICPVVMLPSLSNATGLCAMVFLAAILEYIKPYTSCDHRHQ